MADTHSALLGWADFTCIRHLLEITPSAFPPGLKAQVSRLGLLFRPADMEGPHPKHPCSLLQFYARNGDQTTTSREPLSVFEDV